MPGVRLSLREREEIAYRRAQRMGVRQIAAVLDRDPATMHESSGQPQTPCW